MTHFSAVSNAALRAALDVIEYRVADDPEGLWDHLHRLGIEPGSDAALAVVGLASVAATALSGIASHIGCELNEVLSELRCG